MLNSSQRKKAGIPKQNSIQSLKNKDLQQILMTSVSALKFRKNTSVKQTMIQERRQEGGQRSSHLSIPSNADRELNFCGSSQLTL